MTRNLLLASVAILGFLGTLVGTGQAQAGPRISIGFQANVFNPQPLRPYPPGLGRYQPVVPGRNSLSVGVSVIRPTPRRVYGPTPVPVVVPTPVPVDVHYHVMYRECPLEPWQEYASYDCHRRAHAVANRLRFSGYQARVLHH